MGDRLIQRLTRGRVTLLDIAGLPNLKFTVVGRKSGVPRSTPLLCVPYGESFLVAGSYFGGPRQPVWVVNLEAAGRCTIRYRARTTEATAHPVTGEDRRVAWEHMLRAWPSFALYEQRTAREIKVYELTPV